MPNQLTAVTIRDLFARLNQELAKEGSEGELYLVGGAVMCLVFDARAATRDVDAIFKPAALIRHAAARVARDAGVPEDWLNDGVKGFLGGRAAFDPFLELSHLKVFVAQPEYLLALKCAAMRLGPETHDLDDIRYLLRYLNVDSPSDALDIVTRYFDAAKLPAKTRLALEELLT
ncbi:MAG: hypothetical protein WD081_07060 [Gammaproteobacteria bacterium]